jgi:hypothetical protein
MLNDVERPAHYTAGNIEVVDFIKDQKFNYCEGNVVKYICRYKYKGTPEKDLRKARQYIDFLLGDYAQDKESTRNGTADILRRNSYRCNALGTFPST